MTHFRPPGVRRNNFSKKNVCEQDNPQIQRAIGLKSVNGPYTQIADLRKFLDNTRRLKVCLRVFVNTITPKRNVLDC